MYTLAELFAQCDRHIVYEETENKVNYQFKEEDDTLYIFFEPSEGKLDWKHNFQFGKQPYRKMTVPFKVHRGFCDCWKEIELLIVRKIKETTVRNSKIDWKWQKIIIVGYSHGGALAMLCHECCVFHRSDIIDNIKTIAFDGPRVFAGLWVSKKLKPRWKNFRLIRNHNDLVTHVPPKLFGYSHVGKIIHIGRWKLYGPIRSHFPQNIYDSLMKYKHNEDWETSLFQK